jgi:hypothetical protein
LYRATNDKRFLTLIQEIAHNLPQYMARLDRQINGIMKKAEPLAEGIICERVNISDWEGVPLIGAVYNGACWCEVSLMLTCAELPGIYIVRDKGIIAVFDHVEAKLENDILTITNNTKFDANVKIFVENSDDMNNTIKQSLHNNCETIFIKSGKSVEKKIQVKT